MSDQRKRGGVDRRKFLQASAAATVGMAGMVQSAAAQTQDEPEAIRPFSIAVPDAVLEDLRDRLVRTRYPDQLAGAAWTYGTELSYLKELCDYWRTRYDWRAQERALNRFDHFRTEIDGLGIHFIHQRSRQKRAIPLIVTHGWPASVFELTKIIGPLSDPIAHGGRAADAFHVVCPSMPGYGFSDAPRQPGFGVKRVAEVFAKLMDRLGYTRYGAQGGDWGALVSTWLARQDAAHVCGIHLSMILAEALDQYIDVPTGCALFPVHPQLPRQWVENSYNVTRWTKMKSGGHFAALEEPDLLVEDIRGFFRDLR